MDFLKLLRSLEEFLYELCTWLLFFPRTLYRVVVHPRRMAQYVDTELKKIWSASSMMRSARRCS